MIIRCKSYDLFLTGFGTEEIYLNFSGNEADACELSQEDLEVFQARYGEVLEYQVLAEEEVC